jgi:hypothetical protein
MIAVETGRKSSAGVRFAPINVKIANKTNVNGMNSMKFMNTAPIGNTAFGVFILVTN